MLAPNSATDAKQGALQPCLLYGRSVWSETLAELHVAVHHHVRTNSHRLVDSRSKHAVAVHACTKASELSAALSRADGASSCDCMLSVQRSACALL